MADIVDKATRSRIMASITAKNTKPELTLRRALHARGRYQIFDILRRFERTRPCSRIGIHNREVLPETDD